MDVIPNRAEATSVSLCMGKQLCVVMDFGAQRGFRLQVLAGKEAYLSAMVFADRVFITISQYKTFGTLVIASQNERPGGESTISVRTVLGAPDREEDADAIELIARRLAATVHARFRRPLFIGCGLQNYSMDIARDAVAACEVLLEQATGK